MFSGAFRYIDQLHFDHNTRSQAQKQLNADVAKSFRTLDEVFKKMKLNELLEHIAKIEPDDDETFWRDSPPELPKCD